MLRFILQGLAGALGFWIAAHIVPGVHATSALALIEAGLLLGVINALVRPLLILLTLPLTIITLGFFLLVVNAITVWLTTRLIHGVHIHGFSSLILTVVVLGVTSILAGGLINQMADDRY